MDIDDILADVSGASVPEEVEDQQALTRAWVSERVAPEILPYPATLMARTTERIRVQVERVETQTGTMDPKTSFATIVLQTELERFKFLVRSFLRARLAKIDVYVLHILSTPSLNARLAPEERQYAKGRQSLLHEHFLASFLRDLPEQLRRLDDTAGGISMIETPDLEKAVICRVLRDMRSRATQGEMGEIRWKRGDVHVLRYALVRERVLEGDIELI